MEKDASELWTPSLNCLYGEARLLLQLLKGALKDVRGKRVKTRKESRWEKELRLGVHFLSCFTTVNVQFLSVCGELCWRQKRPNKAEGKWRPLIQIIDTIIIKDFLEVFSILKDKLESSSPRAVNILFNVLPLLQSIAQTMFFKKLVETICILLLILD